MILQMRNDIEVVEEKLGRVGKGCGRSVVGGKASGLAKLQEGEREGKGGEELAWAARMKVLDMCGIVVGRLLKRGGSGKGKALVLAAKVLVLSRLLVKSVGDSAARRSSHDKEMVEEADRKQKILRKRLRRAIERTLEKIGGESRDDLVNALSAYSLATNSGTKDVLRHFLHIRGEAMALSFEEDEEPKEESPGVLKALELYARTLLDVQALVPRRLSDALAGLKTKGLLKDEAIREVEGLRLDTCEKWFGDEITFFTPYIRHDDLEGPDAVHMLKSWSKKAIEVMLQGLEKTLDRMNEFTAVVDLRTRILEIWIKEGGKARGFDPSVLLDGLRKAVNSRMLQLLESKVSKLHLVATEVEATLGSWQNGVTDKIDSLWDESLLDMDISNGAVSFKESVLARTYGRNDAVSRVLAGYQTWRHLIDEIINVLERLKKQRWDDDLEDIEDDLSLESRNTLLSSDDPQMLQDNLDARLEVAYKNLNDKLATLLATYDEKDQIGQISVFLLRVIRDIRSQLPKNTSLQKFGLSLVPSLHNNLSSSVSESAIQVFAKHFRKRKVVGKALWEGEPSLPVQPSPGSFKFLHSLVQAMGKAGGDLWSPAGVAALKKHTIEELSTRCTPTFASKAKPHSAQVNGTTNGDSIVENGEETNNTKDTMSKDALIQALFDILLLEAALEIPGSSISVGLNSLRGSIEGQVDLDPESRKRLQQASREYWKRSSLLFGLLA